MKGAGWTGPLDETKPSLTRPEQQRCFTTLKAQGLALTRPADYEIALTACDTFFLLERALTRTGGRADRMSLRQGIESLGSSFAAGTLTGQTRLLTGRHYGASQFALFGYVASCNCFKYSSSPQVWR
jgi:hypothetical protein